MAHVDDKDDHKLLWGTETIGTEIDRTPRQTNHLLVTGSLKGAVKIGGRWCITRGRLRENFRGTMQEVG